ncbi:MAG: zinc ribbon domain-containing protein [Trichodesmium sp. St18_bin1]|nr:zinc ribbon domain-containing protein [Trichodesmium sp. St18_bin1]
MAALRKSCKCQWYGCEVVIVNIIFASSKTCSNCGHVQDLPLSLRTNKFS